jgi:hypothetical protein
VADIPCDNYAKVSKKIEFRDYLLIVNEYVERRNAQQITYLGI